MGGYSDSSDEDRRRRKKKKRRSLSRSREASVGSSVSSRKSAKHKSKKKKRQRSRSRSPDAKYSRRRSRSPSRDRGYRRSRSRSRGYDRRSRSRSYDRGRRRSRSRSRGRGSYSRERKYRRSRSRDRRSRSRSFSRKRSYSHDRRSGSRGSTRHRGRRSRSSSQDSRLDAFKKDKDDPCAQVPGFSDMTPADQAKVRMQLALRAAAAADEKLKEQGVLLNPKAAMSAGEQRKFNQAVQSIEKESFAPAAFTSNRDDPSTKEEDELGRSRLERNHDTAIFGSTKLDIKLDPSERTNVVYNGAMSLAHPNLQKTTQEKMSQWIEKLTALRRKKLEGDMLS
ncbi:serine/Arginine-related protein 53-like [Liolophura sinensis]|uniref:serine/Arginine-related protein 53-like n=1 Tax=Liolophura sinensis TaxID=3198878 RepID=UPI0031598787